MILYWIEYGRSIEMTDNLYRQGKYIEAMQKITTAIEIDSEDFVATFWRLRIAARLGEYEAAESAAQKCLQIEPKLLDNLILPWQTALSQIRSGALIDWGSLDKATDQWLDYYLHHREFSLLSVLGAEVLSWAGNILSAIYYYRKPVLVPDLWNEGIRTWKRLRKLFFEETFGILFVIALVSAIVFLYPLWIKAGPVARYEIWTGNLAIEIISVLIVTPIGVETFYRGILFTYCRQYSEAWAYPIVAAIYAIPFGLNKGLDDAVFHALFSWIYCKAYMEYDSIIAPILLHFLANLPFGGRLILELATKY